MLHYTTLHTTPLILHYSTHSAPHSTQSTSFYYPFNSFHCPLHSTPLHSTRQLHSTALHCPIPTTPPHSTPLLHYTALHYTTLHYTKLRYATLHYTPLHSFYIILHIPHLNRLNPHHSTTRSTYSTAHSTPLPFTPLVHSTPLHYTTLH